MAHEGSKAESKTGQLPPLLVGPAEINRLRRELAEIDETLLGQTLRKKGSNAQMLKSSQLMDQLVDYNQLNLLNKDDRDRLSNFLEAITKKAPVLHISFCADPSAPFLEKLMVWLRENIHPQVLVTIGVQPTIAAGCIVRSTNKYFDFSLRQDFTDKRDILLKQISAHQTQKADA